MELRVFDSRSDKVKKLTKQPIIDLKQVVFQSNANHPLAESTDYIKFEGM